MKIHYFYINRSRRFRWNFWCQRKQRLFGPQRRQRKSWTNVRRQFHLVFKTYLIRFFRGAFGIDGRPGMKGLYGDRGIKGETGPAAEWAAPGEEGKFLCFLCYSTSY